MVALRIAKVVKKFTSYEMTVSIQNGRQLYENHEAVREALETGVYDSKVFSGVEVREPSLPAAGDISIL